MERIFNPQSIAVIGASQKAGSIGNIVVQNLVSSQFAGRVFPINPSAPAICGVPAFKSILDVPLPTVDLAVYTVPVKAVIPCALEAAQKHVAGHVVITSGFSEVGNDADEKELVRIVTSSGGRVVGPNVVGLLLNKCQANASFAPFLPYNGRTALVSQSGALLIALDGTTYQRSYGCTSMVSLGNMSDIDFSDCIDYYASDPSTSCIALYVEGIKAGRRFIDAGRRCPKPIIALKSGVSTHGAQAAASHTGSLAGSVKVYNAAFSQAKVIRAMDLDELLDCSQALALQPPMEGDNIVAITNGGGIGVLCSDAAEFHGVPLKTAPKELQSEFYKCMPSFGSPKNPVDITGGSGAQGYVDSISVAMNSDWVSAIAILYCETALTKPMDIATAIVAGVKRSGSASAKPIVAVFVGGKLCIEAGKYLVDNSIPMYNNPKKAMCALSSLRQYSKFKQRGTSDHFVPFADAAAGKAKALEIINAARADGRTVLLEYESKALLSAYGLPVVTSRLARSEDEAVSIGKAIGFPLVMKIVSPQILHKSEAGGVKVNVKDEEGVRAAYRQILENARKYNSDAMIYGVLIQEMAPQGKEVIIGSVNDSTFGPTVMFGLGGIFVEVLKDVTFRVAPFSQTTALEMVPEIKSFPILAGARGEKPRDVRAIAEIASRVSQMVHELGEEVLETDANPCIVYEEGQGVKIVDARVILSGKPLRTGQRLGKGRYKLVQKVSGPRNASQVWKARDTETKEDVALKFYKDREQCKEQYKRLAAAGDRLGVKLSPHLGGPGNTAVMVMEYGRPLDQILSSEKNSWKWKKLLLHGAAVAVAKGLHAQGLVWTDVKAQNFVVTGELGFEYSVKLIDLESCCKVGDPVEPGSPLYSSLEQLSGKPAAITMDTWSFAIMTLQAHLGAHPYTRIPQVAALLTEVANERANESELKGKILEALKDPGLAKILLPDTLTPPERQFLTLCLEQDPEHRVQLDNVKEEILRDSGSAGSTAMDDKMAVMPWAGLKWIHTLKFVNDPKCPFLKTCRLDMKPAFPTGIQVADLVDPKMQDALAGVLGKAGAQSAAEVGKFLKQHLHGESFRGAIHSIDFVWNEFAAANLVFTKLPLLNGAFSRIPQTHNWENPNGIYQLPIDNPLIEKDEAPECNNMNTGHSDTQALFIAARRKVNAAWRALTGSKPWAEQLAKHFPNVSLVPVVRASNPNFVITNACYGFPNINTRDPGYFGKGHYFTTYMDYAAKYKSEGTALRSEVFFVGLVATACVFPVVEDPFSPTNTLMGKAQVNSYDSHYVLVNKMIQSPDTFVPMSPLPLPQPVVHADIQKDEIVTFESQHVIPLFLLHYFI